jgi:large subunit ribosomal protein L17
MRHRVAGRKLGRVTSHKLATMRNLATSLFEHERIRTTLMKAKEARPFAERLVTLSKKGGVHRRRLVSRDIQDEKVLRKLFNTLAGRYLDRPGGYTRILKLGTRKGDNAEMALLELVGYEPPQKAAKPDKSAKGTKQEPAKKKDKKQEPSDKAGSKRRRAASA